MEEMEKDNASIIIGFIADIYAISAKRYGLVKHVMTKNICNQIKKMRMS
jgi:hypothetical protein